MPPASPRASRGSSPMDNGVQEAITIWLPEMQFSLIGIWMGAADHVGIVIGTDGSRVYTVEGNSGDACKIRSYDVNYRSASRATV